LDDSNSNSSSTTAMPEIEARIAQLRKELDELRRKYTDEHPDVSATKRLIEQLQEQKKEEIEARRKAASTKGNAINPIDRNPVFQQLRVSLAEAEPSVASAGPKLANYAHQDPNLTARAPR